MKSLSMLFQVLYRKDTYATEHMNPTINTQNTVKQGSTLCRIAKRFIAHHFMGYTRIYSTSATMRLLRAGFTLTEPGALCAMRFFVLRLSASFISRRNLVACTMAGTHESFYVVSQPAVTGGSLFPELLNGWATSALMN